MAERTVSTTATARRDVEPERVDIEFQVTADRESPEDARTAALDAAESLCDALPEDGARRAEFRMDDETDGFASEDTAPYTASKRVEVACPPSTASEVLAAGTETGATATEVSVGLEPETYRAQHEQALSAAMERARAEADAVAGAEGLAVGPVRDVSVVDPDGMDSLVADALGSSLGSVAFDPGPVSVVAEVEVVYDLRTAETGDDGGPWHQ